MPIWRSHPPPGRADADGCSRLRAPPRDRARLIVEAANSGLTVLLLILLVRYHRLHKEMALSALAASTQTTRTRSTVQAPPPLPWLHHPSPFL